MSTSSLIAKLLAVASFTAALTGVSTADPLPAVDVVLHEPPPPRRIVDVAWNPLALLVDKVSFDVVIVPRQHHGLVLSPFYAWASTAAIYIFDDAGKPTQLAEQQFKGFGGELGYRYYFSQHGPRGLFVGPSLIVGWFTATAGNGSQTQFLHYGLAADAGYQVLIANRLSLALGGGLQVVATDKSIPPQQFPAKIYANFGVLPRVLLSLGWAF